MEKLKLAVTETIVNSESIIKNSLVLRHGSGHKEETVPSTRSDPICQDINQGCT